MLLNIKIIGVTTTADERLAEAKEHLNDAYKCLMEVCNPETWGHNDFKDEYLEKLFEVNIDILKIKNKLKH